jgi:hypothetical protein
MLFGEQEISLAEINCGSTVITGGVVIYAPAVAGSVILALATPVFVVLSSARKHAKKQRQVVSALEDFFHEDRPLSEEEQYAVRDVMHEYLKADGAEMFLNWWYGEFGGIRNLDEEFSPFLLRTLRTSLNRTTYWHVWNTVRQEAYDTLLALYDDDQTQPEKGYDEREVENGIAYMVRPVEDHSIESAHMVVDILDRYDSRRFGVLPSAVRKNLEKKVPYTPRHSSKFASRDIWAVKSMM